MRRLGQIAAIGLIIAGSMVSLAFGDECSVPLRVITLVPNERSRILMAFELDDKPASFMLDTGAFWGFLNPKWMGDRESAAWGNRAQAMGGRQTDRFVSIRTLSINHQKLPKHDMLVAPEGMLEDDIAGIIGANYLQNFDVEIDLANNRVTFFAPFKCDRSPVYWTKEAVTEIPIDVGPQGHIFVKASIDGQRIRAIIDTGAPISFLTATTAEAFFGLKPGDAGMEETGTAKNHDGSSEPVFLHRFATLDMGGVVFKDPWIKISKNTFSRREDFDLLIGVQQLRELHLYISYKKHRIYATKAFATPIDAAMSPGHPAATQSQPDIAQHFSE